MPGTPQGSEPAGTSWTLPRKEESVPDGRRTVLCISRELLGDDRAHDAQVCASELLTNAVEHGSGPDMRLTVSTVGHVLLVGVDDAGAAGAVKIPGALEKSRADFGRGLSLVRALATRWGVEQGADGTSVWFEIDAS